MTAHMTTIKAVDGIKIFQRMLSFRAFAFTKYSPSLKYNIDFYTTRLYAFKSEKSMML